MQNSKKTRSVLLPAVRPHRRVGGQAIPGEAERSESQYRVGSVSIRTVRIFFAFVNRLPRQLLSLSPGPTSKEKKGPGFYTLMLRACDGSPMPALESPAMTG